MAPIPTFYKGYHFRSRTEARWAIFLDTLNLRWEYEVEGHSLPSGRRYLPDFQLYLPADTVVLEVKAEDSDDHAPDLLDLLRELANHTRHRVVLLPGQPAFRAYTQVSPGTPDNTFQAVFFQDYPPFLLTADAYWFQTLDLEPETGRFRFRKDLRSLRKSFGRGLVAAVHAARAARFEHGEQPGTT